MVKVILYKKNKVVTERGIVSGILGVMAEMTKEDSYSFGRGDNVIRCVFGTHNIIDIANQFRVVTMDKNEDILSFSKGHLYFSADDFYVNKIRINKGKSNINNSVRVIIESDSNDNNDNAFGTAMELESFIEKYFEKYKNNFDDIEFISYNDYEIKGNSLSIDQSKLYVDKFIIKDSYSNKNEVVIDLYNDNCVVLYKKLKDFYGEDVRASENVNINYKRTYLIFCSIFKIDIYDDYISGIEIEMCNDYRDNIESFKNYYVVLSNGEVISLYELIGLVKMIGSKRYECYNNFYIELDDCNFMLLNSELNG